MLSIDVQSVRVRLTNAATVTLVFQPRLGVMEEDIALTVVTRFQDATLVSTQLGKLACSEITILTFSLKQLMCAI